jgi:predicted lipoprotein with Yx(FWY)xxD motif
MMRIATGLAALLVLSSAALAAPAMEADSSKGKILVDEKGMSLYIFDNDEAGKSNCYNQCATNWPPLMAAEGAAAEGDWSLIKRTDGTEMWGYKGKPVYLWIKDTKPGDVTGDGVGGVWHLATP